jgi:hypothetical protein
MIEWLAKKLNCERRDIWLGLGVILFGILLLIFKDEILVVPLMFLAAIGSIDELLRGK